MTNQAYPWEIDLLEKAYHPARSARHIPARTARRTAARSANPTGTDRMAAAYNFCEQITRENSRTFYLASSLLPVPKRCAIRALYAFCRISDDLVDKRPADGASEARASLEAWKWQALGIPPAPGSPVDLRQQMVAQAWNDTCERFSVPRLYAEQLIEGVAADLEPVRYRTFEQLSHYAYGVASTVGLMAMHIIGFTGPEAIPYAVRLGVTLQLTNILRDVGEDWQNGRLYLPVDELAEYGLTEEDIARGRVTHPWRRFMRFQIARARRLYAEAMPGIRMLDRDGRFAIGAAARLYEAILAEIEAQDYDVFNRRAHVSAWGKLRRLPRIWREVR